VGVFRRGVASPCPEDADMQIIKAHMQEGSFFVRYISAEIFAADHVPSSSQFAVEFALDDSGHLAVLLRFEYALHVGHFLDGRVGHAHYGALLLGLHVGVADQDLLGCAFLSLAVVLSAHICITDSNITQMEHIIHTSKYWGVSFY
jgi:hypothetical protein